MIRMGSCSGRRASAEPCENLFQPIDMPFGFPEMQIQNQNLSQLVGRGGFDHLR